MRTVCEDFNVMSGDVSHESNPYKKTCFPLLIYSELSRYVFRAYRGRESWLSRIRTKEIKRFFKMKIAIHVLSFF